MIVTSKTSLANIPKTLDELAVSYLLAGNENEAGIVKYYDVGAHIADGSAHLSPTDHYNFEHLDEYAATVNAHINEHSIEHFTAPDNTEDTLPLTKKEVYDHSHSTDKHFDTVEGLTKVSVDNHINEATYLHFDEGQKVALEEHIASGNIHFKSESERDNFSNHVTDKNIHLAKDGEEGVKLSDIDSHINHSETLHFSSADQKAMVINHIEIGDDYHFGDDLRKITVAEHIKDSTLHIDSKDREILNGLKDGKIEMEVTASSITTDYVKADKMETYEIVTPLITNTYSEPVEIPKVVSSDIKGDTIKATQTVVTSSIESETGKTTITAVDTTKLAATESVSAPVISTSAITALDYEVIEMSAISPDSVLTGTIKFSGSEAYIEANEAGASIAGFNDINSTSVTANTISATREFNIDDDLGTYTFVTREDDGKVTLKADKLDVAGFKLDTFEASNIIATKDVSVLTDEGVITLTSLDDEVRKTVEKADEIIETVKENTEEIAKNRRDINDALTALNLTTNAIHKVTGVLDYSAVAETFVNGSTIIIDFDRSVFVEETEKIDLVKLLNAIDTKLERVQEFAAKVEILVYNGNFDLEAFDLEEPPAFNENIRAYIFATPVFRVWSTDMLTSKMTIACYRQDCDTEDEARKTIFHVTCEQNEFNSGIQKDTIYEVY